MQKILMIGHGNVSMEEFLLKLKSFGVEKVIDVRRTPYSGYVPHFNQGVLKGSLMKNNISYFYIGDILGWKPDYGKFTRTSLFESGFKTLVGEFSGKVVLMCSEMDYTKCHRRFIAQRLVDEGFKVENIIGVGEVEGVGQKGLGGYF